MGVFGSMTLGAAVGYWLGIQQTSQPCGQDFVNQFVPTSTPTPTPFPKSETTPTPTPTPPQFEEEIDETTGWTTYTDSAVGFTLKYPSKVVRKSSSGEARESNELSLTIFSRLVDELDFSNGYDRETALEDRQALSEGNFGEAIDWPLEASKKVRKINNKYAKDFLVLIRFHIEDVAFERKLIFYNDGYQTVVTLFVAKDNVTSSMPQYFKTQETGEGEWSSWDLDRIDDFYKALTEGKGSSVAQEWYDTFDKIVETIVIE